METGWQKTHILPAIQVQLRLGSVALLCIISHMLSSVVCWRLKSWKCCSCSEMMSGVYACWKAEFCSTRWSLELKNRKGEDFFQDVEISDFSILTLVAKYYQSWKGAICYIQPEFEGTVPSNVLCVAHHQKSRYLLTWLPAVSYFSWAVQIISL